LFAIKLLLLHLLLNTQSVGPISGYLSIAKRKNGNCRFGIHQKGNQMTSTPEKVSRVIDFVSKECMVNEDHTDIGEAILVLSIAQHDMIRIYNMSRAQQTESTASKDEKII
jgi:hypothetical protein